MSPRVAVIIPSYNGETHLRRMLPALRGQQLAPSQIVVIDSSSRDGSAAVAREHGCRVEVIPQTEFNHGGTRNRAAALIGDEADVLVFMTQDALPADEQFLAELVAPVVAGEVMATYARQEPYPEAAPGEVFTRRRNYPDQSQRRAAADIARLGLRAFFFSNVASAIGREAFHRLGGFPERVIMNEDMLFCARALEAGGTVAYQASARVFHSHNYSFVQQFRRYFDIGAFLADQGCEISRAKAGGDGVRFAAAQFAWLIARGHLLSAIRSPFESALKFVAFHLGRRHRWLPRWLKRRCSMHALYWR